MNKKTSLQLPIPHRFLVSMRWAAVLLLLGLVFAACAPATPPPTTQPPAAALPTQAAPAAAAPTLAAPVATAAPAQPTPVADLAPQLVDRLWVLVTYGDPANPTVVEAGVTITALFSPDGSLSGSGGCNNYHATYQLSGDQLTIGPIASTKMACEKGMDQESAVLAGLQNARRIVFSPEGRLEIFYDPGTGSEQQLVYALGQTSLTGTVWVLQSLGDPNNPTTPAPGAIITILFSPEGVLGGSSGCNNYSASYTAQDGQLQISEPAVTMMECPLGMEADAAYLGAMKSAESYQISGPRLEISYDGGKGVLRYTSKNLTLENTLWTLASVNDVPNNIGTSPTTILFEPGPELLKGTAGGSAMCNQYHGSYTVDQNKLTLQNLAASRMVCPGPVMIAETSYFDVLKYTESYLVMGQTLIITSSQGSLVYAANRAPLEGTHWRLTSMGPASAPQAPAAGADFTAQFMRQPGAPSGVIIGGTGCNDYNATYVASLNEIKVNPPATTNNAGCAAGLPELEQQYFLALNTAASYRILGDSLQIPYGDGQMLSFNAYVPQTPPEPEATPSAGGPLTVLNGTKWWLVSLGSTPVVPGSEVTSEFAINPDGKTGAISGSSGCNTYNAAIEDVFQIGPAAATRMMCANPPGVMEQESSFLTMLDSANSFSMSNNQLIIDTPNGPLVYHNSPAPMAPVVPSQPIATPAAPQPTAAPPLPQGTPELPTAAPTAQPF